MNEKTRSKQHMIGDKAVKFFEKVIPDEWVIRNINPDYGIDLDVEIFDYEDGKCISLGEHVFIQMKGTESPQIGKKKFKNVCIDVLKFSIEVSELNLVDRMGSAFPVMLIVVDLVNQKAYHVCLNDYIRKVLPELSPDYKNQKTVTIYIPLENEISSTDFSVIQWYGIRTQIYSMFHEMLTDIVDLQYSDDLYNDIVRFVEHYKDYHVLSRGFLWSGLKDIRDLLYAYSDNNYKHPSISHSVIESFYNKSDFNNVIVEKNAYYLSEFIKNYSGMFETYCRTWYMPFLPLGVSCISQKGI